MKKEAEYIAVFLIMAKDPVKEFQTRAEHLINEGKITREQIPDVLDVICKMKGNAGEIGREIRKKI